jgi:hypothetical protein
MTKHTPATPLPWHHVKALDKRSDGYIRSGLPLVGSPAVCKVMWVTPYSLHTQNAAYIAHACNAYPKLVEVLRNHVVNCPSCRGIKTVNIRGGGAPRGGTFHDCVACASDAALLRSLGEE